MNFVQVLLCCLVIWTKIIAITNPQPRVQLPGPRRGERAYVFNQEIMDNYLEQRRLHPGFVDHVVRLCSSCLTGCIDVRSRNRQDRHEG
jgi:hypothetical protein